MYLNKSRKTVSLILSSPVRYKHGKDHWSVQAKKKFPKHRALEHFDDFYKSVFGRRWASMRVALLSQHKYVALVNNFGDTENTISQLENSGALNLRALYEVQKENLRINKIRDEKQQDLNKIHEMDRKMEQFLTKQHGNEVDRVYSSTGAVSTPDKLQGSITNEANVNFEQNPTITASDNLNSSNFSANDHSLSRQLQDADYDTRRLINPQQGTEMLHDFIPATKLKGMEDWVLESDHYKYYENSGDFPVNVEPDNTLTIPETANIYTYEEGNISDFRSPRRCSTGVLSHYLFDGASILPVLALDLQPGDKVLDACAAPGGKSLLMLQTLFPSVVVCNDVMESRTNRLKRVLHQYLYDFDTKWKGKCVVTQQDARVISDVDMYDKVLVDVPCTTDRHSLSNNENNIFKPTRMKERLKIPEVQSDILSNCLRLVRPGGFLVYSTCSLSPVQNDGVVHLGLRKAFEQHGIQATVRDLTNAVQPLNQVFRFGTRLGLRYGQLVVPYLPSNFGPMYFSKLQRIK